MSPSSYRLLEFDGRKSGDYTDGNLATIASTKRSRFNLTSRFGRRFEGYPAWLNSDPNMVNNRNTGMALQPLFSER